MWFLLAFLSSGLYAVAEVFDNFLANKEFRHPFTLTFFTSLFNFIFVPILFIFQPPEMPPLHTLPIFALLGLVGVGYLYPYYKGLKVDDTSVVISFFAIGRIFIPILAFLVIGEILHFMQYVGIFLIIVSVVALGLHHRRTQFKMSKAVWYITWAAFFIAIEGICLKLLFVNGVSVSTAIGGESIIGLLFGMSLLFVPKIRKDIIASTPLFIKLSPLFLIEELFTFLGLATEGYAISLASVSVVKGITTASPFFLLIYAWLGARIFPALFKENLHRKKVMRKLLLFLLLTIGILLVKE